jgi:hypothetical protein
MLGSVLAFFIWAVIYTYVWPGKPPVTPPAGVPTQEAPTPIILSPTPLENEKVPLVATERPPDMPVFLGPPAPALAARIKPLSQVPFDVLPSLRNTDVGIYDPSDARVGQIKDVLVGHDGKVVGFIVGVGDSFLGGQGKDIAVPFQAVQFPKKDDSTRAVLFMTKDAVQSAPKQKFDNYKMKWVPDTAP